MGVSFSTRSKYLGNLFTQVLEHANHRVGECLHRGGALGALGALGEGEKRDILGVTIGERLEGVRVESGLKKRRVHVTWLAARPKPAKWRLKKGCAHY